MRAPGSRHLLPATGTRHYSDGRLYTQTANGRYWASAADSAASAQNFGYHSGGTGTTYTSNVGYAFSLRCIKI